MRVILALVVPVVLLLGLALVLMWVPLPDPLPAAQSSARTALAAVSTGLLGLVYLLGITILVMRSVGRASGALDAVFGAHGLSATGGVVMGRAYAGDVVGRSVRVRWMPGYGVRPGQLVIRVAGVTRLNAAVADHMPLRPAANSATVPLPTQVGWSPVALSPAAHSDAMVRLFSDASAALRLRGLLAGSEPGGVRELTITPGELAFRARPTAQAAQGSAGDWLQMLVGIAGTLEIQEQR